MVNGVEAVNFQSWKHLKFSVTKGVTLIDGFNEDDLTPEGSGKSAVVNAMCWTYFGKLPKDVKVDDVIKHGEANCGTSTTFSNGDCITRTRKPNDLFIKLASGKIIKGKDSKETQDLIEEYIGCNFETFCQSIYFAQNYDKKFLSSNQEERGKILSGIQNLSLFDRARREVMDLLKIEVEKNESFKNKIQVEKATLNGFHSQKTLVQSFIEEKVRKHKEQESQIKIQIDRFTKNLGDAADLTQRTEDILKNINIEALQKDANELASVKGEYNTELAKISHQRSQFDSIKRTILLKESEGRNLTNRYNTLQERRTLGTVQNDSGYLSLLGRRKYFENYKETHTRYTDLTKKKTLLEAYIQNPSKTCPSCGSELKNPDVSHVHKELSGVESEMDTIIRHSAEGLELLNQEIFNYEIRFKKDQESTELEMTQILKQLEEVGKFLDENKIPDLGQLTSKELEIRGILTQIDSTINHLQMKRIEQSRLQSDLNNYQKQVVDYHKMVDEQLKILERHGLPDITADQVKLKILGESILKTQEIIQANETLNSQCIKYMFQLEQLKDGFKEIKSYVFNNALTELNFRTNQYLNNLFEIDASIKFTTEDQKIETRIVIDGRETSLGLLSGGQHRRFNLAVDLALSDIVARRNGSKINILILDEYFKDLSESSMEKCLELLKSRKTPVIIIEHNSIFKNIVDNTFFVKLENGTSNESKAA